MAEPASLIKQVWEVVDRWAFTRTRVDQRQAVRGLHVANFPIKVEVRYGAGTVRVVLIKGTEVTHMWDITTRDDSRTRPQFDQFAAAFNEQMRELGVEKDRSGK